MTIVSAVLSDQQGASVLAFCVDDIVDDARELILCRCFVQGTLHVPGNTAFGSGGHYLLPALVDRLTAEPVQILGTQPTRVKIEVAYLDDLS